MSDPKEAILPPAQYMNVMRVRHTTREFFFEFGQSNDGSGSAAHLVAALVTNPQHAKQMLLALRENIAKYEEALGVIPEPQRQATH